MKEQTNLCRYCNKILLGISSCNCQQKMENEKLSEIESELFSLVNSINNLRNRYNEGNINNQFFNKAINNAMNGLVKINLVLKKKISIFHNFSMKWILKKNLMELLK